MSVSEKSRFRETLKEKDRERKYKMRTFHITVNGKTYVVDVDEQGVPESRGQVPAAAPAPAPAAAPVLAPAPAPAVQGGTPIKAGVAGKVFKVDALPGQKVSAGDTLMILEAMKMEIPVVAPSAGTIATVDVQTGADVTVGQVLATMY